MQTREIPRDQWLSFCDGFSRQHQGWLVNLEVTQDGQKAQPEARELPLGSIAASLKHGDDNTISIILDKGSNQYLTHNISNTKRILLEKTDQGADTGLRIEAADGTQALLQLRSPALPETLDGVTNAERRRS